MTTELPAWTALMEDSEKFFEDLGKRITARRKALGLTQADLGGILDVTQQEVASYENARRRIPVSRLPGLADALSVSVEELLGVNNGASKKRGPVPALQRRMEQISRLPKNEQKFVIKFLDNILQKAAS